VVRLHFASDGILCAATFIGEILYLNLSYREPPEEERGVEFPRKSAILADCTTIIDMFKKNASFAVFFARLAVCRPPARATHCRTLQHTATHCNTPCDRPRQIF